jgi:hypothetical protein
MVRHLFTDIAFAIDFSTHVKPTAGNQFNRRQSVSAPIYGIIYDGIRFRFFIFDGSTKPYKFSEGVVPGSHVQNIGLRLEDFSSKHDADPFVLGLRPICETIFNFFLVTYIATLKEFRERTRIAQHERVGSLAQWDQAINLAEEALEKSLHAEACRQNNSVIDADATAETALKALQRRYVFVSFNFLPLTDLSTAQILYRTLPKSII